MINKEQGKSKKEELIREKNTLLHIMQKQ